MSDAKEGVATFAGPSGADWCCRSAMHGPPDHVTDSLLQWLIFPGPPISAYFTYCLPREDPSTMQFFHQHPSTWSVHIVVSGRGEYAVDTQRFAIAAGSIAYHGPGVPHSIYPLANEHLAFVVVQHPAIGHVEKEWLPCPESGTADRPGDLQAFLQRFGSPEGLADFQRSFYRSERWLFHTQRAKSSPKAGR
jgi:mannose-6-phosphate isomerase-like protein (cupin superfamily)